MNRLDPQMKLLAITPQPEELVCLAARNDYLDGKIPDMDFVEIMEPVDGDTVPQKMRTLLKKLMLSGHWGPFEAPHMTIWFRASRSCMAQITRHRHVSFDIQSQRYVDMGDKDPASHDDFTFPPGLTEMEIKTREGRKEFEDEDFVDVNGKKVSEREWRAIDQYGQALNQYNHLVEMGVPKEDARMLLPTGIKVNMVATLNLRTAMHLVIMRGAGDAQSEIQHVSQGIVDILERECPIMMDIWKENRQAILRSRLSP